jgi:hypothetical protein
MSGVGVAIVAGYVIIVGTFTVDSVRTVVVLGDVRDLVVDVVVDAAVNVKVVGRLCLVGLYDVRVGLVETTVVVVD